MTKDELRALLADLVPAAIADGKLNHFQTFSKVHHSVRATPNAEVVVQTRAPRPMRMYRRQGRMGAGFEIETQKKWGGVRCDDPVAPAPAEPYVCPCGHPDCDCDF